VEYACHFAGHHGCNATRVDVKQSMQVIERGFKRLSDLTGIPAGRLRPVVIVRLSVRIAYCVKSSCCISDRNGMMGHVCVVANARTAVLQTELSLARLGAEAAITLIALQWAFKAI